MHLSPAMSYSAIQSIPLLYISPDQILPLTSALGAIVGVLLIVWQRLVAFARKGWQWVQSRRGNAWNGAPPTTTAGASAVHTSPVCHTLDDAGGPEPREGSG
jgi:hypothetical protein